MYTKCALCGVFAKLTYVEELEVCLCSDCKLEYEDMTSVMSLDFAISTDENIVLDIDSEFDWGYD